jgi:hypothetical protein
MAGGPLQTAADLARVFLHSAAAGIPEFAERTFGDPANADRTDKMVAKSQADTGFAGDLANVAGYIAPAVGGLKALKGLRALPSAVRAAPKAAEAIPALVQRGRVALTNAGGPGITKAEAAARLGIDYVPTLAEKAIGGAGRAVAGAVGLPLKHPIISALTGLGALAEYGQRSGAGQAKAATAPAAAPKAAPAPKAPKPAANADKVVSDILSALHEVDNQPTFSGMAAQLAQSQGGKVSLRQLSALGDLSQHAATADYYQGGGAKKGPKPGEEAARLLEQQYLAQYQKALSDPNADTAKAAQEFEEKVLQLNKSQLIDPYGLAGGAE